MIRKTPLLLVFLHLAFLLGSARGEEGAKLAQVLLLYKKGAYAQAISHLDNLVHLKKYQSTVFYWKGLCHNKLQEFDKAITNFEAALALDAKNLPADIHYEYGQALYAADEIKKARKAFASSVAQGYLVSSSYYYMGFIDQTLKQYHLALKHYKKIPNKDKEVAQAASFQVGEIILIQAKEKLERAQAIVKHFVIPQMELARSLDENSSLAADISHRMTEIKDQFGLNENKMNNGRRISEKRTFIRFQEGIFYDTNVITEADEAAIKATPENKESAVSKANLTLGRIWTFDGRFVLTPEVKLTHDFHFRREAPAVYKNDSYSINPKLEARLEHSINKQMAALFMEGEFSYTARDVRQNKSLSLYGRTINITLGEKFKIFNAGESTLKIKRKQFEGQTDLSDSETNTFSAGQTVILPNQHLLLGLINLDFTSLPKDDVNSSNSYMARVDYIIPNYLETVKLAGALNLTWLDTKKQKAARGTELAIAPSFSVARNFSENVELTLKYDYTKNNSKAKTTNAYTKHVYGLELQARF